MNREIIIFNISLNKKGKVTNIVYQNKTINVYVDYGTKEDFFGIKNGIPLSIKFLNKEDENYILNIREELLIKSKKLNQNDIVGSNLSDAYNQCVSRYSFDKKCSSYFGFKKMCLALNATKEGYGVQMLPYSNWTHEKHDTGFWTNTISNDLNYIDEEWGYIYHKDLFNDKNKRLIFAKNNIGNYVFLGVYSCIEINKNKRFKKYKLISDCYPI